MAVVVRCWRAEARCVVCGGADVAVDGWCRVGSAMARRGSRFGWGVRRVVIFEVSCAGLGWVAVIYRVLP